MHQGGTALLMAAEGVIENARRLAARLLQAGVDAVRYEAGQLRVAGDRQEISLEEVARASYQTPGDDVTPGLAHRATHLCDRYTFPNGCHVAEVEIDPETGQVRLDRYVIFDDYGRLLDPRQTLGQVHGGVAQGIGQALFEHALFDAETGPDPLGFADGLRAAARGRSSLFEGSLTDDFPSRANRLGVKGSGQAGAIAAPRHHHERRDERADAARRAASRHARNVFRIWHAIRSAGSQTPGQD
jgi:carbon-monoxide dehydrogenase large subunit